MFMRKDQNQNFSSFWPIFDFELNGIRSRAKLWLEPARLELITTYYPFTKALSFSAFVAIRSMVIPSSASVIKMAKSQKKSSFSSHLQEMNKNKTEIFQSSKAAQNICL